MHLDVFIGQRLVGWLSYENETNQFDFEYASDWLIADDAFSLAPSLPLEAGKRTAEAHSRAVRTFFENLLPEGKALDDAATTYSVSKTSVVGLLAVLGKETAGALRILAPGVTENLDPSEKALRPLPWEELSERIRERAQIPFSVWDRKVRLSIAGYQDKLAVYQDEPGHWFLANGPDVASTHILKPEPATPRMAGLTSNEFFCMRLAQAVGLPVAPVQLFFIPDPVLLVTRFDRKVRSGKVQRLAAIDGCQALGLSVGSKYERPFGNSRDVKDIRTGASLRELFKLQATSARPLQEKQALLRWTIFQVLIGNTDAHAKNLTFLCGPGGLSLAPTYDLVAGLLYADDQVEDTYAMAIGDAFRPVELTAYEWASFCHVTGLRPAIVQRELASLAKKAVNALQKVKEVALAEGANPEVVTRIEAQVRAESTRQIEMAKAILEMAKLDAQDEPDASKDD